MSFKSYLAAQGAGLWNGLGDVVKHGAADIGDTYQEILTGHSVITPPDGLPEPKQPAIQPTPDIRQPDIEP